MRALVRAAARVAERPEPNDAECCVHAHRVLREVWPIEVDRVPLARWRLFAGESPWSPVEAARDAGLALRVTIPPADQLALPLQVGRWHLCQGWSAPNVDTAAIPEEVWGHTWLWWAATEGLGVRLDSVTKRPLDQRMQGLESWPGWIRQFHGGVAVAVLRPLDF